MSRQKKSNRPSRRERAPSWLSSVTDRVAELSSLLAFEDALSDAENIELHMEIDELVGELFERRHSAAMSMALDKASRLSEDALLFLQSYFSFEASNAGNVELLAVHFSFLSRGKNARELSPENIESLRSAFLSEFEESCDDALVLPRLLVGNDLVFDYLGCRDLLNETLGLSEPSQAAPPPPSDSLASGAFIIAVSSARDDAPLYDVYDDDEFDGLSDALITAFARSAASALGIAPDSVNVSAFPCGPMDLFENASVEEFSSLAYAKLVRNSSDGEHGVDDVALVLWPAVLHGHSDPVSALLYVRRDADGKISPVDVLLAPGNPFFIQAVEATVQMAKLDGVLCAMGFDEPRIEISRTGVASLPELSHLSWSALEARELVELESDDEDELLSSEAPFVSPARVLH